MKALIVNGDDFGLCGGVNAGIVAAHQQGILTAASLLTNFPAFDHAVLLAEQNPQLDLGLHLNVTAGEPVLPADRLPSLTDPNGRFYSKWRFVRRMLLGRIAEDELSAELSAQWQRISSTGLKISHVDSHHHVHVLPVLSRLVRRMAARNSLNSIRSISRPGFCPQSRADMVAIGMQTGIAVADQMGRPAHPDFQKREFHGFELAASVHKRNTLLQILARLAAGQHELMCHPAQMDAALEDAGARKAELDALCDPDIRCALHRHAIDLSTFKTAPFVRWRAVIK